MSISAGDNKWERRLLAAFKRRVSFELSDVDLLEFLGGTIHSKASPAGVPAGITLQCSGPQKCQISPE